MKPKYYAIAFILAIFAVGLLAGCINRKPVTQPSGIDDTQPSEIDKRCNWHHEFCKNICGSQNYYFDSESGQCYKYIDHSDFKGCCTPPPFETLEECQEICEE